MTLEDVMKHIAAWIAEKKTGSIQINMFRGGVSNINLTQCIKSNKDKIPGGENDIYDDLKFKCIKTEKEGGCSEGRST